MLSWTTEAPFNTRVISNGVAELSQIHFRGAFRETREPHKYRNGARPWVDANVQQTDGKTRLSGFDNAVHPAWPF